ncbi:3'-5' exonuclease [uncultured Agitococcus sp.]|uniref:3'-5' exonuclease n=1 Tax=uncultured Agitococcus sp. TaxID=1506599 RepID=UPI0026196A19|nr:3'-5' exonuclease [uncultured Agitococcus sp.]
MAIFVYITEKCQQRAKNHQLTDALDQLVADIEREQAFWRLDAFPHPFWVKKRLGNRHTRLVCRLESHEIEGETHDVLVCLDIFQRGDKEYHKLYLQIRDLGDVLYQQVTDHQLLITWLKERCQQPTLPSLVKPSEEEDLFLYAVPSSANHHEYGNIKDMVYESWSWVEHGLKLCSSQQLEEISQQLAAWDQKTACLLLEVDTGEVWILPFVQHHVCLLTFNTKELVFTIQDLMQKGETLNIHDFQKFLVCTARRVYPQSLLKIPNQWLSVQHNFAANLAFSPEESHILHFTLQEERPFPLFINGRAGSGKSTILQYLFSGYLNFAYQAICPSKPPIYPVYFTCNQTLTDRAAETINQILLACNPQQAWLPIIKTVCLEFRGFLLKLMPTEQQSLFGREKWLDYGRFRRLWEQKFGQQPQATQEYPASLCWHIIRSYIKGLNADYYLEPSDYLDLAEDQRSVSDELYQTIYEKVWEKWYQPLCKKEGYWDDQDLARFVLEQYYVKPRFAAVFCDEAQDFTRIEVQIVLRLNLFSARHLYPNQIQRVPLVFAGDQFQTLNPTGFRWETIKAQVVEQFIFALDPAQHATLSDINYRELSYNFRSTPAIAQFSNIIHGLRAKLFGLKSLVPQQSWQTSTNQRDVILIDTQDHTLTVQLAQQYDLVIVLPCLDGQETSYIQNNPILKQYLHLREDGSTSIPAMSVIRAKGLEFQRVVIYGFAADCPADLDLSGKALISAEQKIQQEYFLNRLYVAVTRARSQLLIIDSPTNNQQFWQHFQQPLSSPLQLMNLPNAQETWVGHLGSLRAAVLADITPDANQILLMTENATKIYQEGTANQDPYLLRQAAALYEQLGDYNQQQYCLAEVQYIAEDYYEAGILFEKTAHYERAFECFWRVQDWQKLYDVTMEQSWHPENIENKLREEMLELYIKKTSAIASYVNIIRKLVNHELPLSSNTYDKKAWHNLLTEILIQLPLDKIDRHWKKLYNQLKLLDSHAYFSAVIHPAIFAEVAYLANVMDEACRWWEKAKEQYKLTPPMPRYAEAVAVSRPFPKNLDALVVLQRNTAICQQFADFTQLEELTSHDWQLIIDIVFKMLKQDEIITLFNPKLLNLYRLDLLDVLIEYSQQLNSNYQKSWAKKLSKLRIFRAATQGDWSAVLEAFNQETEQDANGLTANIELILYGLAHSDAYSQMVIDDHLNPDAQTILQLIKKRFLQQVVRQVSKQNHFKKGHSSQVSQEVSYVWRTDIKNPRLLGAVLERSQSFSDALQFYECLENNQNESHYAKRRWLACKLRQAEYFYKLSARYKDKLELSTRVQEREELEAKLRDTEQKAEQNQNTARREARLLGINNYDDIPQYPPLPTQEDIVNKVLDIKKDIVIIPETQEPVVELVTEPVQNVSSSVVVEPTLEAVTVIDKPIIKQTLAIPFSKKPLSDAIVHEQGLTNTLSVDVDYLHKGINDVMQATSLLSEMLAKTEKTEISDMMQATTLLSGLSEFFAKTDNIYTHSTTGVSPQPIPIPKNISTKIAKAIANSDVEQQAMINTTMVAEPIATVEVVDNHHQSDIVVEPIVIVEAVDNINNIDNNHNRQATIAVTPLDSQNILLLPATRQPVTELYLLDYRLLIVRSQGRLNIEHQKTGETVSIWPKNQRIQGDWLSKQAENGFWQLQGTCLWLQFSPDSHECLIAIPEHGLSLKLNCV